MKLSHLLYVILPGAVMAAAATTHTLSHSTSKTNPYPRTTATTRSRISAKSRTTTKPSATAKTSAAGPPDSFKASHHRSSSTIARSTSTSTSIFYSGGYYCSGTVSAAPPMFTKWEILALPCPLFEGIADTSLTCCDPQVGNSTLRTGC